MQLLLRRFIKWIIIIIISFNEVTPRGNITVSIFTCALPLSHPLSHRSQTRLFVSEICFSVKTGLRFIRVEAKCWSHPCRQQLNSGRLWHSPGTEGSRCLWHGGFMDDVRRKTQKQNTYWLSCWWVWNHWLLSVYSDTGGAYLSQHVLVCLHCSWRPPLLVPPACW